MKSCSNINCINHFKNDSNIFYEDEFLKKFAELITELEKNSNTNYDS